MTFECVICGRAADRWPVNDQCHQCDEALRREDEAEKVIMRRGIEVLLGEPTAETAWLI